MVLTIASGPEGEPTFGVNGSDEDDSDSDSGEMDFQMDTTNIRDNLTFILQDHPWATSAFSYRRTHTSCPNPALDIDGFGIIGLPLTVREATALKEWIVNSVKSVGEHGVWDIDPTKVRCEHPGWPGFLEEALRDVCSTLGVKFSKSKPTLELTKLRLMESGFSIDDIEKDASPSAFANIVVVLPSRFTGGALHVKYSDRSEEYDYSANSSTSTTVLAWYAGTKVDIAPIAQGHQLALYYNVTHTTDRQIPSVSSQDGIVSRLNRTFALWNETRTKDKNVPSQMIYLLKGKYLPNGLREVKLEGQDARSVTLLSSIGKLHGITVGLATLACTAHGHGNPKGCADGDESEDEDWDDIEVDPYHTEVAISNLVGLDGTLIKESLEHDLQREGIPPTLVASVTAAKHDKQTFSYNDFQEMYFKRVFLRTVAVVWPR